MVLALNSRVALGTMGSKVPEFAGKTGEGSFSHQQRGVRKAYTLSIVSRARKQPTPADPTPTGNTLADVYRTLCLRSDAK